MKLIRRKETEDKKYYYIPVSAKFVEYKGESLLNILSNLDEEIANREEEYLSFYGDPIWGTENFENFMDKFKEKTHNLYNERGIIEKIGVVYDKGKYRELKTNKPLEVTSDTWLELTQQKLEKEDLETLVDSNKNYDTQVKAFFKSYEDKKKSIKVKVKELL